MAETTKAQAKNSEIRSRNTERVLEAEKGITQEHEKQAKFTDQEIAAGVDFADMLEQQVKLESDLKDKRDKSKKQITDLSEMLLGLTEGMHGNAKIGGIFVRDMRKELEMQLDIEEEIVGEAEQGIEIQEKKLELMKEMEFSIAKQGDLAKSFGDKIEGFFSSIGGDALVDALGIKNFGNQMSTEVMSNMVRFDEVSGKATFNLARGFGTASKMVGALAKRLMALVIANPITALAAAAVGLFMLFRKINRAARDLANELSFSKDQLDGQLVNLKLQEAKFKVLNLDASKLKVTLTTLSEEFRDLSLVTAENAANIEQFAQNAGIGGSEVAKLNKKLMVMEGLSFDAALNMQEQAAAMAKAEGLAVGRVLNDMASAAEDFARFSRDGADGLAEAAVAAAKLGLSLDGVLKASEGLLDFESSITKEFEAQVLTGQALNLERARQAALAGDQEGLLQEIRSIAQGVNVESMNVIQKDAIAGAIGISVADLMRVSRGESLDKQQTQIDLQKKTNDILINGFQENTDELKNIEENTKPTGGGGADNLTGLEFEMG
jgi:hypothetical protein